MSKKKNRKKFDIHKASDYSENPKTILMLGMKYHPEYYPPIVPPEQNGKHESKYARKQRLKRADAFIGRYYEEIE